MDRMKLTHIPASTLEELKSVVGDMAEAGFGEVELPRIEFVRIVRLYTKISGYEPGESYVMGDIRRGYVYFRCQKDVAPSTLGCTCLSHDLFAFGCKCGGFAREQAASALNSKNEKPTLPVPLGYEMFMRSVVTKVFFDESAQRVRDFIVWGVK